MPDKAPQKTLKSSFHQVDKAYIHRIAPRRQERNLSFYQKTAGQIVQLVELTRDLPAGILLNKEDNRLRNRLSAGHFPQKGSPSGGDARGGEKFCAKARGGTKWTNL